jgi:DNA polymerase elongation subunit (family B)
VVELINAFGVLAGKVWSDAYDRAQLEKNVVALIEGEVQEYQGILSIVIHSARILPDARLGDYLPTTARTPTVVFDIETVGRQFDQLNELEQNYLLNNLERDQPQEVAEAKTGLHPLLGEVAYIAMLDAYQKKGIILGYGENLPTILPKDPTYTFSGFTTERELLEAFWKELEKYQQFVTYNGHGFDWPFLIFRSAVRKVRVPIEFKPFSDSFIDLQRKIRPGSSRPYSLAMVTQALGITNPKAEGVSGDQVSVLYREGKHQDIVDYVGRDVIATAELFHVWAEYLAGKIMV